MIKSALGVAVFLAVVLGAGCGFNESPHKCTKTADCPANRLCVWAVSDGCSGFGHCEDNPNCKPVTAAAFQGCGCNGMPVFDLTSTDPPSFMNSMGRFRENTCGWDGPVTSTTACR